MKTRFLSLLVLPLGLSSMAVSATAQVQRFDPVKTREVLEQIRDDKFIPEFKVVGEYKSEQAERFVKFYKEKVLAKYIELTPCISKVRGLSILIDNGGYKDEAELEKWKAEKQECYSVFNELDTSEEWTAILKEWNDLAQGLSGDLPDEARKEYKERMQDVYPPAMQPLLNELSTLSTEYGIQLTKSKANKDLAKISQTTSDAIRLFRAGELSWDEATKVLRKNYLKGGQRFVAYEAVQALPDHLNRMAVIRADLAKSKGFKTWAEFVLANDEGYDVEYRGVKVQLDFLYKLAEKLSGPVQEMVDNRIREMGLTKEQVDPMYESLVFPQTLSQLRPHFPADQITDIWEQTMVESGFQNKELSQILVDDKVREKKNLTTAYMAGIKSNYTDVVELDGETLNYIIEPKDSLKWKPGLSYILQSYKAGGVGDMSTMFHEGGHALEKTLKFKTFSKPEAYAYVETPSTTMEYFMADPQVLFAKLVPIDGQKPSLEEVTRLVNNSNMLDAVQLLYSASSSIFDIELWHYDYSAPGAQTFMQRVESLTEMTRKLVKDRKSSIKSRVGDFYGNVASMHYYSGLVRNAGYVFADLSSRQMATYFSDELEKATGRRDWLNQPMLAELFGDRFFAEGWKLPFPQNIETITGRKFDPESLVERYLESMPNTCESALK